MRRRALIALLAAPGIASAHTGEPLAPHDLWAAWQFDPWITIPLAITAILYARGARKSRGITAAEITCFWSGWGILFIALCSPLHTLGEVLFCAHMTQHELLMLGAAPLLVLARPLAALLWGLPMEWRRRAGRLSRTRTFQKIWIFISAPFVAWLLHAIVLWTWHAPVLFNATLTNDAVHAAQHISFLGSALLFWWSLFHGSRRREYGAAVLYIFTTGVHTSILGALLTFSHSVWYPVYTSTMLWGLRALEDQQIGGLIMWVPAGVVYVAAALGLLAAWLRESDVLLEGRKYAQ